ncbi:MAG: beta-ketoacyl-[acyl-carrier-protein] synthase family protein [Deltaproteobacteria bacterium]|nr:beta-ketoacyl-[acyl-carrier-protein] synthase family protein [Deltaproteobacteria bacterium]
MSQRRVVITGFSAITPIGSAPGDILDNLLGGVSGVAPLRPDTILSDYLNCQVFAGVDYPLDLDFPRKYAKTMGPAARYACYTAREAIARAGLTPEYLASGRVGVAFGSTQGSPTVQREIYQVFFSGREEDFRRLNGADYLRSMSHTTAANISRMFGITGRVISSCTACTTSSQSIGFGYEAVKFGLADAMLCGGADEYDTTTVAVFDKILAASHSFNDRPTATPRPFDQDRDGLVIGEGAGCLVLEELESARRRGAPILGEVLGFACTANGGDMIMPQESGIENCLRLGLADAGLNPTEVDFVSAHATATRAGDQVEAQALARVYGPDGPLVTGFKGHVGHTMGSCGVIESVFTLLLMARGAAAPTLNLETVDPACAGINHTLTVREAALEVASVQNFAFGGVNTVLFYKKTV